MTTPTGFKCNFCGTAFDTRENYEQHEAKNQHRPSLSGIETEAAVRGRAYSVFRGSRRE